VFKSIVVTVGLVAIAVLLCFNQQLPDWAFLALAVAAILSVLPLMQQTDTEVWDEG
jgi:hypothetical protein